MKETYAWVPWFQELARKIAEGGETYLAEAARKVAWRNDDKKQPLLNYGDENIDPFSFFYSLAQRSQDAGSRKRIYPSIKKEFNMEHQPPVELEESGFAYVFPTPSYRAKVLFHNNGRGNPNLLWRLFRAAVQKHKSVDSEIFDGALNIGTDWKVKLTQALFLVNPLQFLPCDGKMDRIVEPLTSEFNWLRYKEWLEKVLGLFPGCKPFEVNLFAYLTWSDTLPVRSDRCFQVSTNAKGHGGDYWKDFRPELDFEPNHWVFTGGPGRRIGWEDYDESRDGSAKYPLSSPEPGDVILVRTGTKKGRGMGMVYRNDYRKRLGEDSKIHVIWLNKETRRLPVQTDRQGFNYAGIGTLNAFRQTPAFLETFTLLDRLSSREELMTSESETRKPSVKHPKNQILYGPPGTGKTYQAVNRALAIIDSVSVNDVKHDIEKFRNLRLSGQIEMVTFHQNYAYEDFIEGIRPVLSEGVGGQIGYKLRPGIFKRVAEAANAEEDKRFVLIIDEINRGNIAKIFGELITLIEDSRRLGANDETNVKLPYSNEPFGVPRNLYLIGTMNTADRSIQLLDAALRRRFDFVEMMPEPEHPLICEDLEGVKCRKMLKAMNSRITALLDREHQIGHTYLLNVKTMERLSYVFQNRIFPLLQEYFFNDWSKIRAVLGGNDFVKPEGTAALFRDNEQEVEEQVYRRLPDIDTRWTESVQYRNIYETPAEQSH